MLKVAAGAPAENERIERQTNSPWRKASVPNIPPMETRFALVMVRMELPANVPASNIGLISSAAEPASKLRPRIEPEP